MEFFFLTIYPEHLYSQRSKTGIIIIKIMNFFVFQGPSYGGIFFTTASKHPMIVQKKISFTPTGFYNAK